ncbi:MAG: hypothetical protein ACO331_16695 [Prochlorothrix sp.]
MEFSVATLLATLALGLMVVLTGGIAYLTAADWRDRRRQKNLMRDRPLPPTPRRKETPKSSSAGKSGTKAKSGGKAKASPEK